MNTVAAAPASSTTTGGSGEPLTSSIPAAPKNDETAIVELVHQAILLLPDEEKAAFVEAFTKARALVLRESNPVKYYHLENGNEHAAAQRLASFWTVRKNIFKGRFLLPMLLTGKGALTETDIETLKTGYLKLIQTGSRQVCIFNADPKGPLLQGPDAPMRKSRCMFYVLCVASQSDAPFTMIRLSHDAQWEKTRAMQIWKLILSAPLTKMDGFLALFAPPAGAKRMFEQVLTPLFEDFFAKNQVIPGGVHCKIGESAEELASFVTKKLGITRESLPISLGGSWSDQCFKEWFEDRVIKDKAAAPRRGRKKGPPVDPAVLAERKERKRKSDAVYARSRRRQEKDEEATLQSQYSTLSLKNKELRREGKRLAKLLQDCKMKAANIEIQQNPVFASIGVEPLLVNQLKAVPDESRVLDLAKKAQREEDARPTLARGPTVGSATQPSLPASLHQGRRPSDHLSGVSALLSLQQQPAGHLNQLPSAYDLLSRFQQTTTSASTLAPTSTLPYASRLGVAEPVSELMALSQDGTAGRSPLEAELGALLMREVMREQARVGNRLDPDVLLGVQRQNVETELLRRLLAAENARNERMAAAAARSAGPNTLAYASLLDSILPRR